MIGPPPAAAASLASDDPRFTVAAFPSLDYEAGLKTLFPEQRLLLNGSVHYYRDDNEQSLTLGPNSTGSGVPCYLVRRPLGHRAVRQQRV